MASIETIKSDLVIVGCGIAGLSAAVSALQSGVSVTLLERAPEEEFGGNTRWMEAYLRMKNDRRSPTISRSTLPPMSDRISTPTWSPRWRPTMRTGRR
jgi:glycine/D-amino acid oxidase-like deaminating enzyme